MHFFIQPLTHNIQWHNFFKGFFCLYKYTQCLMKYVWQESLIFSAVKILGTNLFEQFCLSSLAIGWMGTVHSYFQLSSETLNQAEV